MSGPDPGTVTLLLRRAEDGDRGAIGQVFDLLYRDLEELARGELWGRDRQRGLQTADLVHDAFVSTTASSVPAFGDRGEYLAWMVGAMRNLLKKAARRQQAQKRGGDRARVPFEEAEGLAPYERDPEHVLALEEAFEKLERIDREACEALQLRYVLGLTVERIAREQDTPLRTVERRLGRARAWLRRELEGGA